MGIGADCLGLVRGVYQSLYGRTSEEPPAYSSDWCEATGAERLLEAAQRNLCEGEISNPQLGDVLIFRMFRGTLAKHAAILITDTSFVHATEKCGVVEVPFSHWWRRRLVGVFGFPGIED